MIKQFLKLFKRTAPISTMKSTKIYKDGFYLDINTIGEKSKTVWSEYMRTPDGEIKPILPEDRIEIH